MILTLLDLAEAGRGAQKRKVVEGERNLWVS